MNKNKKQNIYEEITNDILKIIESEQELPWNATWFNKQINGYFNKEYQGINNILLSYECYIKKYNYPIWFTFKQVNQLGGKIQKGAKSSKVYFSKIWVPQSAQCKRCEHFENDTGHCQKGLENWDQIIQCEEFKGKKIFIMKSYNVFNIEDTTLNPEDYVSQKDENLDENLIEAEKIIDKIRLDGVNIEFCGTQPCYMVLSDKILMPPKELFINSEEYYLTFFHEAIHSTGHEKRLNRKSLTKFNSAKSEYSYEELVAELGANILMKMLGLKMDFKNSAAYIKGWASFLKEHKKAIVMASCEAQKAVDYIIKLPY